MRRLRWPLGCGLFLIVGLVTCSGGWTLLFPLPFDAVAWRSANWVRADLVRQRMVADLLDRPLIGMTKAEVRALLGEPTMNRDGQGGHYDYAYWLGPENPLGVGFENEYLGLKFENGRVAAVARFID